MLTVSARFLRAVCLLSIAACAGMQAGCCHHYCYQQSGCPPLASNAGVVRYGSVCEAPEGGSVVAQSPSRSSSISDAPRPRVVVSEPGGRLGGGGWRRSDPENFATTRVEGAIDDETRSR